MIRVQESIKWYLFNGLALLSVYLHIIVYHYHSHTKKVLYFVLAFPLIGIFRLIHDWQVCQISKST